jgi:hypothetical protein
MKPRAVADLYREAEKHDDYRVAGLVHDFTEALARQRQLHPGDSRKARPGGRRRGAARPRQAHGSV